tara:strand:- start:676 stop:2331 length:1656 start_codon:yes stop_codon:yes gene_type:complete
VFFLRFFILIYFLILSNNTTAQEFSRKDSLRGSLTDLRSCYDVTFYDLFVIVDEKEFSIEKSYNIIYMKSKTDFNKIQIDLAQNLEVFFIEFEGDSLKFNREYDAIYINFDRLIKSGENIAIKVWYGGYPKEALNPPWEGGFTWEKDNNGNPWIGVSCQGIGASTWWPCKDHQSDEPDSMRLTCTVRYPLKTISNGNLIKDTTVWNQYLDSWTNVSEWFVSYPINNYNVTLCIGDYVKLEDKYISLIDTLKLEYYVLSYNKEKAKLHFQQVKPMLECFENYFGKYPFKNDGYSLIETSYLGMEHQSGIAYGNKFLPGYNGNVDFIDNLNFDYIIVHETGHEWWGNSITTNDIADLWIHEGFCTYSEALYVECIYGYDKMLSYINNQKKYVRNDKPVIGLYNLNKKGSNDMYFKGSLMLHTLRNIINDDNLWFDILKDISIKYKHQTIDGQQVIDYIDSRTKIDLKYFFKQYLENKNIPILEYRIQKKGRNFTLIYRWDCIEKFEMPILINNGKKNVWIKPNSSWQEYDLGNIDIEEFTFREDLFFFKVKKQ